ncbi:kynureninase [Frondihabitans sp. PAMC 28766]|uniref:kynureninase n=1 Tax=Frondihabitans sp. PAMC 28766 TaxID=1795630 RepID=UPI00078BD535|nr:aminotransferase class V-fold PLP-dependent enzyme [Frondihabitans sp. PAMC 28766]AMM20114.1 kynureninase [Frondihabitans sp. PAMC 28766]
MNSTHDPAPRNPDPLDAAPLDAADPLAAYVDRFVPAPGVAAYLDGNSLGRPLRATADRFADFVAGDWGTGLIRSWDDRWMDFPTETGDRIATVVLGSAPGQTVVGDSTTVLLYKAIRATLELGQRQGRHEILLDDDQFPTDRFVIEGIARERGATVRWIRVDPALGVTPSLVRDAVSRDTAVVVVNHVSYRSGFIADLASITRIAHEAGALAVWDLCHSVGVVPFSLDDADVDLAVGCTYKFLNGGPGAPAFLYARADLHPALEQPIQGWMGAADVFEMASTFEPASGIRRFLSGTPPIVGMLAMNDMLDLLDEVGLESVRAKSLALTDYAFALSDALLAPLGVVAATPREHRIRASHVTLRHEAFRATLPALWAGGVVPDFRNPDALRLGLSPLSTTFAEVRTGVEAIVEALRGRLEP